MKNEKRAKGKIKRLGAAILLMFAFSFLNGKAQAQESLNSAGGKAEGDGGSATYSFGQISYQTYSGANGSIVEGAQQPYEISVLTGIDEAKSVNLSVLAYPNPVSENLILTVDNFDFTALNFQIYSLQGKLIQSGDIKTNQTSIDMGNLEPSIYFMRISSKNQSIKEFKIIKK